MIELSKEKEVMAHMEIRYDKAAVKFLQGASAEIKGFHKGSH